MILPGLPDVGKTHLAVGLGLKALEVGMVVYYTTLSDRIKDLKKAQALGYLDHRWRVYLRPAMLVIDEIEYSQLRRQEAELFFRLISQRYEHGSIILTGNKYFSGWRELLSDNVLVTVLLDRLLHYAHVLNIRGETYRLKDRRKTGVVTVLIRPRFRQTVNRRHTSGGRYSGILNSGVGVNFSRRFALFFCQR